MIAASPYVCAASGGLPWAKGEGSSKALPRSPGRSGSPEDNRHLVWAALDHAQRTITPHPVQGQRAPQRAAGQITHGGAC